MGIYTFQLGSDILKKELNLIQIFEKNAIKQYEALEKGNARIANKCFNNLNSIIKELYKNKELETLKILLSHNNINVRCQAAIALLIVEPERAEKELEKISLCVGLKTGTIAGIAKMTLQEWRKGNIKFDY